MTADVLDERGRAGSGVGDPGAPAVVVTRDEGPEGPLTALLLARGLRVHHWPTIRFAPPEDTAPLDDALADLAAFDWVVFSSPRSVDAVARAASGEDPEAGGRLPIPPAGLRVAAVGPSTAEAALDAGWTADLVPDEATGAALVDALAELGVGAGDRVFFPASEIARDVVPTGLRALGAEVTQVVAYRTVTPPLDRDACGTLLASGELAALAFTSPSTVQNLKSELGPELFSRAVETVRAVAIGPTTAEAVREAGWTEVAEAETHTLEGLADRVARVAIGDADQEAM